MNRVVLDTNVLVSSAYDDLSASWKIIEACIRGELTAIVSPALRGEYDKILAKTVSIRGHEEQVRMLLSAADIVHPVSVPRVVEDDPEDDKVIAAAVTGRADAVITNDHHLLTLDPYTLEESSRPIRILRPVTFEHFRTEAARSGWRDLARLLGIR